MCYYWRPNYFSKTTPYLRKPFYRTPLVAASVDFHLKINPLSLVSTKRLHILKQTLTWKLNKTETFFLQNHAQNPRLFYKKSKLSISLDQQPKMLYSLFLYIQVEVYQNILKLKCWPLVFTLNKAFWKNKRSGSSLPALFSAWFLKKNISHVIFY